MKNKAFSYYVEDSRNIKKILVNKKVDVIITSPPYWNLKDYGVDNQIGFGQSYERYLEELITILNNCKEILNDKGSMWIIVDSFKKGGNIRMLPFEIADRLQKRGWHLQDIIIWQKDKTLPWSSKGKLRNIFEYILFFTKSNHFNFFVDELREVELKKWWPKYPERYNPKGKVPSRVWDISIPVQGWGKSWVRHFCPFPPRLIENILFLTTKKKYVVLDPFAGSGSVLAQATVMGRKAIGFDLNPDYRNMYYEKVLPFFRDLWVQRKQELDKISKKRKYLGKTIPLLRRIKYPILLYKKLIQKYPNLFRQLNFIIAENNKEPTYYFVFDRLIGNIEGYIDEETKNEKMKKFSLIPTIKVISINEANHLNLNQICLYENGVNNFFSSKTNYEEWLAERCALTQHNQKVPPIISNIKVHQKTHLID